MAYLIIEIIYNFDLLKSINLLVLRTILSQIFLTHYEI